MDFLLHAGAAVNSPDADVRTPLHCAAGFGAHEVVDTRLKAGADVYARNVDAETPRVTA